MTTTEGYAQDSAGSKKQYLTFHLREEKYGILVLKIREIVKAQDFEFRHVPIPLPCLKGVILLRDTTFMVIDLSVAFNMGETDVTDKTSIIIVEIQKLDQTIVQIGLLVDHVDEVMDFLDSEITSGSSVGQVEAEHIVGFGQKKDLNGHGLVIILDINKVISGI